MLHRPASTNRTYALFPSTSLFQTGAQADPRAPAVRHHDELVLAKVRAHVFGNPDRIVDVALDVQGIGHLVRVVGEEGLAGAALVVVDDGEVDRKSTRLNSSH